MIAAAAGDSTVLVESLDREGRGITRVDGKAVFVEGALPGERVSIAVYKRKPSYDLAHLAGIHEPSPCRIEPPCPHFGVCGGCSMQHLQIQAQVAVKQQVLEDALERIGRVQPEMLLSPIVGPGWRYRHRARLSVRLVRKKGGVLVGFHEKNSSYVADMTQCLVLPERVSAAIPVLRRLIGDLSIRERLPQIEVAVGDAVTVLVLRVLEEPTDADQALLRRFAEEHGFQLWLQRAGPESAQPFWPLDAPPLDYVLDDFGIRIRFRPTDFTQVNHAVNRVLVRRAMQLLAPRPGERIADFFSGLGNFSLPIARLGAEVVGVEGHAGLVARAGENAAANGLSGRCAFHAADLFAPGAALGYGSFDKALIDPPREGAIELVKSFDRLRPKRVVYVSCDPATLARDAGVLVNLHGYRLSAAGIANMFPQTSHVESLALFERPD